MESVKDYNMLQEEPQIVADSPRGGKHIPIDILEGELDRFHWSTKNYHWNIFKDGYANLVVAASIELVLQIDGVERTFVGCCNLDLKSIAPIPDWNATAKSMCIKNAASEVGKRLGRGLNDEAVPTSAENQPPPKIKPDTKIMKQFMEALEKKDEATITLLSNIYDIKTE